MPPHLDRRDRAPAGALRFDRVCRLSVCGVGVLLHEHRHEQHDDFGKHPRFRRVVRAQQKLWRQDDDLGVAGSEAHQDPVLQRRELFGGQVKLILAGYAASENFGD